MSAAPKGMGTQEPNGRAGHAGDRRGRALPGPGQCSEVESFLDALEERVKTRPIEAECRGSNGACAPLDGTKRVSLWLTRALQGQSADVARATASICNDEWACFGVISGRGQKTPNLSVQGGRRTIAQRVATGGASSQSGAALLLAMITVALVATLAASALWCQWRGVEIESAERARVQSDWILTGALDWGRLILQGDLNEDMRKNQLVDDLTEPWAVPLAEARLSTFLAAGDNSADVDSDAFLAGQISDLQARLNVMNLTAGSADDQLAALERFDRLFEQLGLPSQELGALQRALARAQQAMTRTPPEGDAPLLPTRFDQLAWLGLSAPTLERLRPYVTVLPLQNGRATPVNLNTASATVIQAAIPGLDRALAERLVSLRAQQRFTSVAQAMTALERSKLDSGWAAVSSSFFEIRGRLRLDDVALEEVAVVQRQSDVRGRSVRTLWRARSALTVPPAAQ